MLDLSKLKAFADIAKMRIFLCDRLENFVEKGDNAGYHHFLLFQQCFQKLSIKPQVDQTGSSYRTWELESVSFHTDDDTRYSCGQWRSRSDCTECAVWYLTYTVHIFILDYNYIISSSCSVDVFLANENLRFIYSLVKELNWYLQML